MRISSTAFGSSKCSCNFPTSFSSRVGALSTDGAPETDATVFVSHGAEFARKLDVAMNLVAKFMQPPEAEQYTVTTPEGITSEEFETIKINVQLVARTIKSFLTGLTSQEINNPQFHFLNPTHNIFTFFTSLVDSYSNVLMPPKGLVEKPRKDTIVCNWAGL